MTAQKEEWVQVGCDIDIRIHTFESSIAGEISCFVFPDFSYYKQQM